MQGSALQLKRLLEEHNLQRYPDIAGVLHALDHGVLPDAIAEDLLVMYRDRVQDAIDHPNFLHRAPDQTELYSAMEPDIEIGQLEDRPDVRFGIRYSDQPRSILLAGNAGSGKTTACLGMIRGAHRLRQSDSTQGGSIIVFDKKLDYTGLPDELGDDWLRVSVHDALRIGLNAPEGVPTKAWINIVASIFCARAGLIAAWTAFGAVVWWLLGALNPDPLRPQRWPSLPLVLEVLHAAPDRLFAAKSEYVGSLKTALQAATQAVDTFDCFGGIDLERDIIQPGKSIVIEMPNVAPAWVRQFIQDLLLAQLIYGRVHRAQKNDRGAEVIIVMDEADQDATAESDRRFPDQMSPLSVLLRMGREFGLMVIVGASRLNHLSPYVLLEPAYHLILNQSDAASVLAARNTLLLPPGAEQMLPGLQPGMCIARESGGAWAHPMLVRLDHQPLSRGAPLRQYDAHPLIASRSLADLPGLWQALQDLIGSQRKGQLKSAVKSTGTLPEHAHALLHAAAVHPFTPVARLWEKAGKVPSPEAQIAARKALEAAKMAEFEEVRISRRNVLLIRIIDLGWDLLGRTPPTNKARGGVAHTHLANWIARDGRAQGDDAELEWPVPGTSHIADVMRKHNGEHHVDEIVVTCTSNLKDHLRACFVESDAVETCTIVLLQKAIRDKVRAHLAADPEISPLLDRVRFEIAQTYLDKEPWQ